MPQIIEMCRFECLFEINQNSNIDLLKKIVAEDDELKIEQEDIFETVFYFDDGTQKWNSILWIDEQRTFINARPIFENNSLYYKLVEVAEKTNCCLVSEECILFLPQYGLLHDPEERKYIEVTTDELHKKLSENVTIDSAIALICKTKQPTYQNLQRKKNKLMFRNCCNLKRQISLQSS